MAYAVNSIVGSISGIVAYDDNSTSSFNAEMNYDGVNTINFTADATESRDTMGRIVNINTGQTYGEAGDATYRDGFTYLNRYTSTLLSTNFNWAAHASAAAENATNAKKIVDVVYHLNINIAFDDDTVYPVSATYQRVGGVLTRTNHFVADADLAAANLFTGSSNKAAMLTKIDNMFKEIIGITVPSA